MKQFNVQNIEIVEVVIAPGLPIVIKYRLKDENGEILYYKTAQVEKETLPASAQSVVDNFIVKLLARVVQDEGL